MKRIICFLSTLILILSCSISISAAQPEYSLSLPKDFTAATANDDLTDLALVFGIKEDSLKKYYEEHNILYLAANKGNTCQVTLTCTQNNFSKGAISFSGLSYDELQVIGKDLAGDAFKYDGVLESKEGNKYIKLESSHKDSGGAYTVTEYITVCSSKLYTLNVSATDGKTDKSLPETIFKNLSINDSARLQNSENSKIYTIITALGIVTFAAVAVFFTITIIRDLKNNKSNEIN